MDEGKSSNVSREFMPHFFRTHKSHIVNLNCVERYIRGEGGSVVLQDGTEIGVSRTAKAELLSRLRIS